MKRRLMTAAAALSTVTGVALGGCSGGSSPAGTASRSSFSAAEQSRPGAAAETDASAAPVPTGELSFRPVLASLPTLEPVPEDQRTPEDQLPSSDAKPADAYDTAWIDARLRQRFEAWDCSSDQAAPPSANTPAIVCDPDTSTRYIVGPSVLGAEDVRKAATSAELTDHTSITLNFTPSGTRSLQQLTKRLTTYPDGDARKQFAVLVGATALSVPVSQGVITDGKAQITGDFTVMSAKALVRQINAKAR